MSDRHEFHERMLTMKPKEIIQLVSQSVGIPIEEIKSRSRKRELVDARKLMAHFLSNHTSLILEDIGILINTSHSNVVHMKNKLYQLLQTDKQLQRIFNSIERHILNLEDQEIKYKVGVPFLTEDIFVYLLEEITDWGDRRGSTRRWRELFNNKFIN